MKIKQLAVIALALSLAAWRIAAQNDGPPSSNQQGPPPGGPGGRHHRPPPIIQALDANHDGIISADEIANASKALLTLDKNGDGQLTMDEVLGPPPGRPDGQQTGGPNGDGPPPPPVPPIFAALDTDGDGVLSAAEIANAPKSLLKLDKNGDGRLTPDEYRPQRPPPPRDSDPNN